MAAKPIIEIDVKDDKFQAFLKDFEHYHDLLGQQPEGWNEANKASDGAFASGVKSLEEISAALGVMTLELQHVSGSIRESVEHQNKLKAATDKTDRSTHRLANTTKIVASAAKSTASAFMSMAKALTIGGALTGVATGVGLFGIDRLAGAVFSQRRNAMGLGVTSGQQSAFRTNYGSMVDSDGLLGNVAGARNDLSQQWAFRALGIGSGQEAGMNNADLAADVARRARDIWMHGPHTQQYAEAKGLTKFLSMEDLRRLGSSTDADMAGAAAGYRNDQGSMSASDETQREWTKLAIQLHRAGLQIETSLVKGLAPLVPDFTHLSASVSHLISAFLGSPAVKTSIDNLADWLGSPKFEKGVKDFTDWIGSPQRESDLKRLGNALGTLGTAVESAVNFILRVTNPGTPMQKNLWDGIDPDFSKGFVTNPLNGNNEDPYGIIKLRNVGITGGAPTPDLGSPHLTMMDRARAAARRAGMAQRGIDADGRTPGEFGYDPYSDPAGGKNPQALFAELEKARGLPPGILDAIWANESTRGTRLDTSAAGAMGQFQFMPGTAAQYHVNDPNSVMNSGTGAANYLADLKRQFGNDPEKLAAAYNWGPKHLQDDIAQYGNDWRRHLPSETVKYIASMPGASNDAVLADALNRLRRSAGRPPAPVKLSVTNDTSARVAVSANQVAPS